MSRQGAVAAATSMALAVVTTTATNSETQRSLAGWKRAEHLQQLRLPLDLFERRDDGAIGDVPRDLDVKKPVPIFARHGLRLDGLQVDTAFSKMLQHVEQCARLVVHGEKQPRRIGARALARPGRRE